LDSTLPEFSPVALTDLVGFVNAAHATDLEKQLPITGWVFCDAGSCNCLQIKISILNGMEGMMIGSKQFLCERTGTMVLIGSSGYFDF